MTSALAAAAMLVATAFAMATFERWLARRRRHEAAWSAALAFFALASAFLALGAADGWDPVTFRLFYLFGAIVNVPYLALGTVYLLGGERRGDRVALAVTVLAAFAAGVVLMAPLGATIDPARLPQGSDVFGPLPRVLAAVASGAGALVVVVGAIASAWRWRHEHRRLALGNGLIATGTLVTGASGLLNSVLGEMEAFALTLVVGISVIFAGFLVATTRGAPAALDVTTSSRPPGLAAAPSPPGPAAANPRRRPA